MFQLNLVLGRRNLRSSNLVCNEGKDVKDTEDVASSERAAHVVNHKPVGHVNATESSQKNQSSPRVDKVQYIETLGNNKKFPNIVNVNQSGNTESTGAIDPAHLIGRIEDIEPVRNIRELGT